MSAAISIHRVKSVKVINRVLGGKEGDSSLEPFCLTDLVITNDDGVETHLSLYTEHSDGFVFPAGINNLGQECSDEE